VERSTDDLNGFRDFHGLYYGYLLWEREQPDQWGVERALRMSHHETLEAVDVSIANRS
jgi:hypothetical protein